MADIKNLGSNVVQLPVRTGKQAVMPPPKPPKKEQESFSRRSPRARLNLMPDDDTLLKLITRARSALSKGFYWDRGAIVNILL